MLVTLPRPRRQGDMGRWEQPPSLSPGSPRGGSGAPDKVGFPARAVAGGGGTGPLGRGSELRPDLCPQRGNDREATPGAARGVREGSGGSGPGAAGSPPGGLRQRGAAGSGGDKGSRRGQGSGVWVPIPRGMQGPEGGEDAGSRGEDQEAAGSGGPLPRCGEQGRCGGKGGDRGSQKRGYGCPGPGGCGVRGKCGVRGGMGRLSRAGCGCPRLGNAKSGGDLGPKGSEVGSPPRGMRGAGGMRGPVELQAAGERRMRGVPPGGDAESGVYAQSGGG